ncbi:hypothetical protein B0H14DRAFT_2654347 [Mycena olivaceomarginata]|nr:hypothetical protein B0H14DRAFT_2654347 [Mycena olivaceomarginata]
MTRTLIAWGRGKDGADGFQQHGGTRSLNGVLNLPHRCHRTQRTRSPPRARTWPSTIWLRRGHNEVHLRRHHFAYHIHDHSVSPLSSRILWTLDLELRQPPPTAFSCHHRDATPGSLCLCNAMGRDLDATQESWTGFGAAKERGAVPGYFSFADTPPTSGLWIRMLTDSTSSVLGVGGEAGGWCCKCGPGGSILAIVDDTPVLCHVTFLGHSANGGAPKRDIRMSYIVPLTLGCLAVPCVLIGYTVSSNHLDHAASNAPFHYSHRVGSCDCSAAQTRCSALSLNKATATQKCGASTGVVSRAIAPARRIRAMRRMLAPTSGSSFSLDSLWSRCAARGFGFQRKLDVFANSDCHSCLRTVARNWRMALGVSRAGEAIRGERHEACWGATFPAPRSRALCPLEDSSRLLSVLRLAALLARPDLGVETHTTFGALPPLGTRSALSERIQPGHGALDLCEPPLYLPAMSRLLLRVVHSSAKSRWPSATSALPPGRAFNPPRASALATSLPLTPRLWLMHRVQASRPRQGWGARLPTCKPHSVSSTLDRAFCGAQHPASAVLCL